MKHLLKLGGMTPEEILHILDVADEYKRLHKDGAVSYTHLIKLSASRWSISVVLTFSISPT